MKSNPFFRNSQDLIPLQEMPPGGAQYWEPKQDAEQDEPEYPINGRCCE
jgi:hypothetical protein